MSKRWRYRFTGVLAAIAAVLCWAGLTSHSPWLGLVYLTLACAIWVPLALLVP